MKVLETADEPSAQALTSIASDLLPVNSFILQISTLLLQRPFNSWNLPTFDKVTNRCVSKSDIAVHNWSHHITAVTFSPLLPAKACTWFSERRGTQGWVDLVVRDGLRLWEALGPTYFVGLHHTCIYSRIYREGCVRTGVWDRVWGRGCVVLSRSSLANRDHNFF